MTVALVDYPGIKSWYEFVQADHSMTCSAEIFVISTCKLLEARPSDAAEEWANLFVEYLLVSLSHHRHLSKYKICSTKTKRIFCPSLVIWASKLSRLPLPQVFRRPWKNQQKSDCK